MKDDIARLIKALKTGDAQVSNWDIWPARTQQGRGVLEGGWPSPLAQVRDRIERDQLRLPVAML
jgi:hypothetical protein